MLLPQICESSMMYMRAIPDVITDIDVPDVAKSMQYLRAYNDDPLQALVKASGDGHLGAVMVLSSYVEGIDDKLPTGTYLIHFLRCLIRPYMSISILACLHIYMFVCLSVWPFLCLSIYDCMTHMYVSVHIFMDMYVFLLIQMSA